MTVRWPGPDTDDVSVKDELDFDALPWETQMLARRVVKHMLVKDGWKEGDSFDEVAELEKDLKERERDNDRLRASLQSIVDGNVSIEDVVVFAKGALAA